MAEKKQQTTPTGLSSLSSTEDVLGQIGNVLQSLSQPPEAPPIPDTPSLPEVPTPESVQDVGIGTRLGRAATIFAAGMSGNPELMQLLMNRFAQVDQDASAAAQRRFANAMAVTQTETQQVLRTEELKAGAEDRALRQERAGLDRIGAQLSALQLALSALDQDRLRNKENPAALERLSAEEKFLLEAVDRIQKSRPQAEKIAQPTLQDLVTSGFLSANDIQDPEAFTRASAAFVQAQVKQQQLAQDQFSSSAAVAGVRDAISPRLRPFFDAMVQFTPNPLTGERGDPARAGAAANALLSEDPAAVENAMEAAVEEWVGAGRFPNTVEGREAAAEFFAKWSRNEASVDDLPLEGTSLTDAPPGIVERGISTAKASISTAKALGNISISASQRRKARAAEGKTAAQRTPEERALIGKARAREERRRER